MAVRIRLARQGAKKQSVYQVVVLDGTKRRDGDCIARLGQYCPREKDIKKKFRVDMEALQNWKNKGAQLSQTVGQLLKAFAK